MIQNTMLNLPTVQPLQLQTTEAAKTSTPSESMKQFGAYLEDALQQVSQQEQASHTMNNKFMAGQVDVDQVMITSEQALLSLQLTSQIRNKAVEAYQEIMRTQI
ncbi:flagellar hook-basal body complex protein FliE [Paenibacillus sp. JX-17]|uniref:Flagellar hook-basal body complex protein FliE n=1 Tax=Paenibacillus lacisoli TaxID=3064525 RepID=A0ABT9C995_9BACL|nr:flagellar hook-basal body complex protein FliE [Paenibacillus sp. JX-17]MDO7905837.1 flagellar hook-basal body complex protein FliE [Paenibacillus sp. JX-17]